ncbi:MAG: hypothetical protein SNG35_07160 [Rikenellaceae bacterium]
MIKRLLPFFAVAAMISSCCSVCGVEVISEGLTYNEGTTSYDDTILISNFGGSALNPLNTDGLGYITQLNNGALTLLIPADGSLSAPKGMAEEDDYLYIADVGKVVVYNLNKLKAKPQTILFPEGELFVNDIVIEDDIAYISVTNTGNIYTLNVASPANLSSESLQLYTTIPGANGLVIEDDVMYIASYPPDGNTTADNVIYTVENLRNPTPRKLFNRMGQYDGLAIEDDRLYFTNWVDGEVGYLDLKTNAVTLLDMGELSFSGPADITIEDDILYIPDLPNSRLVIYEL